MLPACNATVYGVALNFRADLDHFEEPRPVAPVLYLRPGNTWNSSGNAIHLPADANELKMAGTVGVVIGRAPNSVGGFIAVNDVSIPHQSYYRPAIRQRCRDGFCVIGLEITNHIPREIRTFINNELRCCTSVSDLVRPIDRLIADISEFLTLQPGDILLIGEPPDSPVAHAGDCVRVEVDGLPAIENQVIAE